MAIQWLLTFTPGRRARGPHPHRRRRAGRQDGFDPLVAVASPRQEQPYGYRIRHEKRKNPLATVTGNTAYTQLTNQRIRHQKTEPTVVGGGGCCCCCLLPRWCCQRTTLLLSSTGSEEQQQKRSALIDGRLPVSLDFGDAEQSRYCNSQGVEIVGYDVFDDGFVDVEVFMD